MFEENGNRNRQIKDSFLETVEDSFGNSIRSELFEVIEQNISSLETTYSQAEIQIQEIKMKTIELRSII